MKAAAATPIAPNGTAAGGVKHRWASINDDARLTALYYDSREEPEDAADVLDWLENGGAALLEDDRGELLCAVRWRENANGWQLDPVCTRPDARRLGFGRWLMTKVEALAIRYNIPELRVSLPDDEMAGYYGRLGYTVEASENGFTAHKRVGGTWQLKARGS